MEFISSDSSDMDVNKLDEKTRGRYLITTSSSDLNRGHQYDADSIYLFILTDGNAWCESSTSVMQFISSNSSDMDVNELYEKTRVP